MQDAFFNDGSRRLQDRFETRELADRIVERVVRAELSDDDRAFVERSSMFFLATADAEGRPDCSYKGGDPGFVRAIDSATLVFPSYDGNGMFRSLGNLSVNPWVGMLFIDFENPKRLRINGRATRAPRARVARALSGGRPAGRGGGRRRLPQLSALHPQARAARGLAVRAARRLRDAEAGVEGREGVPRRAARRAIDGRPSNDGAAVVIDG